MNNESLFMFKLGTFLTDPYRGRQWAELSERAVALRAKLGIKLRVLLAQGADADSIEAVKRQIRRANTRHLLYDKKRVRDVTECGLAGGKDSALIDP